MSPSEDELRRALRSGEGARPDTDRIVAAGASARAQRRTRWVQGAAAVVLVGATAAVVGVATGGDGGDPDRSAARSQRDAGGATALSPSSAPGRAIASGEPAPAGGARPSGSATDSLPIRQATCPDTYPTRLLPGNEAPGRLFARPAASITVCAYGNGQRIASTAGVASYVVSGTDAETLQRSLENARSTPSGASCTEVRPAQQHRLVLVAIATDGTELRPVTTTLTVPVCDTRTTNGATTRYAWVPPLDQRQRLFALSPTNPAATLPPRSPSGKVIGSPVR